MISTGKGAANSSTASNSGSPVEPVGEVPDHLGDHGLQALDGAGVEDLADQAAEPVVVGRVLHDHHAEPGHQVRVERERVEVDAVGAGEGLPVVAGRHDVSVADQGPEPVLLVEGDRGLVAEGAVQLVGVVEEDLGERVEDRGGHRATVTTPGSRPPEGDQEQRAPTHTADQSDQEAGPPPQGGEAEGMVEAPLAGTDGGQQEPGDGEHHHVLPPFAGAEDEEPVLQVVGDPGHQHDADHPGAPERGQEPQDQQATGADLGDAGRPGVEPTRLHPQALEPPAGAGDLPASEDVVDTVGDEDRSDGHPEDQEGEVDGMDVGHWLGTPLARGGP